MQWSIPSCFPVAFWRCHLRILVSLHLLTHLHQNRCDILTDSDPPLCQHCKQYGFDCTFFLPIAETRFKKKKQEEEAAAVAAVVEKTRLENAERPNSSTSGESSRPTDARVYGMGTSFGQRFTLPQRTIFLQVQHLKTTFFIPVPRYPPDYMKITMHDTTIRGNYPKQATGSSKW